MSQTRSARSFLIEAIVIVGSILLAFGVDAWWDARAERELESAYLERLVDDLSLEKTRMREAAGYARSRIDAAMLLDSIASSPGVEAPSRAELVWAIETATWRSFQVINSFVYGELQTTGRLALITSEPLRRMLAEHHASLRHDARVGEDLSAQHRFEEAVAGLLTIEEQVAVETAGGVRASELPADPERASEIVRDFRNRPEAVRELGNIVQHHTFNVRVIEEGIQRADDIIGYIRVLQRARIG